MLIKLLTNLASVVRYQNWLIIFFRITKLHNLLGALWHYLLKLPSQKNSSLDENKINNINFSSIRQYHQQNFIDVNSNWYLNGVFQGKNWHLGSKKHADYTRELIFSYLEWIFSIDTNFDKDVLNQLVVQSLGSDYSKEPSSVSLRIYPLIYAYRKGLLNKDFLTTSLNFCFESLQENIELDVGANHLLDNFISLSILSLLFRRYRVARIYLFLLKASLSHSTASGFYEERNPTYAEGLSIRLQILLDITENLEVDGSKLMRSNSTLKCFKERLLNYPSVQINDSYLPFSATYKKEQSENEKKKKSIALIIFLGSVLVILNVI